MKRLTASFLLLLIFTGPVSAQRLRGYGQPLTYQEKSLRQAARGSGLLFTGLIAGAVGTVMIAASDRKNPNDNGLIFGAGVLFATAGAFSGIASIPCFISSGINRRKDRQMAAAY